MKWVFNSFLFSVVALLSFTTCSTNQEAVPIAYGKDQCDFCRMTIANPQFGAELITDKGRVLKYDAVECMVNHINGEAPAHQKLYAVPYDHPGELSAVDSLYFLVSPDFRSPMGANLAAFSDKGNLNKKYHTQLINWQTLLRSQ